MPTDQRSRPCSSQMPPAPGLSLTSFAILSVLLFPLPFALLQPQLRRKPRVSTTLYPTAWMCPGDQGWILGEKKVEFIHKIIYCTISELCNELVPI